MKAADPREVLARARQQAVAIADQSGARALYRVLRDAEDDLIIRLARHEALSKGSAPFTEAQARVALEQVRDVMATVQARMGPVVGSSAQEAAEASGEHVVKYMRAAERAFRGITTPLPLDEAAMMDASVAGTKASVMRRLLVESPSGAGGGILRRYGWETVGWFEREISKGIATRKPTNEVRDALVAKSPFLQDAPRSWADRILRTETAYAYNKGLHNSMKEAHKELGDMVRILHGPLDDRTAWDSALTHGQIRKIDQPFMYVSPDGDEKAFLHPPDRPQDRSVVVAHRLSWPIPDAFKPYPMSVVERKWREEKHKGAMPKRPVMSTVPLSSFAKG